MKSATFAPQGKALFTITPEDSLRCRQDDGRKDIGSLVVMAHGRWSASHLPRGDPGRGEERRQFEGSVYRDGPGPADLHLETEMDEVRRMMLDRHARYMPVDEKRQLVGVISFYDVARPWWTAGTSRTRCSGPSGMAGRRQPEEH